MQTQIPQIPRLALKKSVMRLPSKKSKKSVSDLPEDIIEDKLLRLKSVIRPALKKSKKSVIGPPLKKSKKSVAEEILSSHLPEQIIEEILSRLPVKSLLRFRCVSKSWLSLIESDRFINIHYQNSTKNTSLAHHRALFNVNLTRIDGCSLLTLSNWNSLYSSITSIDPTNHMPRIGYIVGCYNGVVCYSPNLAYFNYALWNPATRVFVDLPKLLGRVLTKSGFGWDESSGAFKVFASSVPDDLNYKVLGQVFSSKTGLWKTVPVGSLQLFNEYGVFVRGRIHWAAWGGREHVIESFNLESDEFERIEVPPFKENTYEANAYKGEGRWPRTLLGEIGGRLCALFHCNEIDVWVMKEYGVKDSWFKLLTLPRDVCLPKLNSSIFGVCQNGEIKIVYGNNFVVYSPKDKEEDDDFSKVINIGCRCVRNHVYVESLVSPLRILGGKTIT